jgi:hypothetical protein
VDGEEEMGPSAYSDSPAPPNPASEQRAGLGLTPSDYISMGPIEAT